ncbi:MAG: DUF3458 domain-containing protein [Pyrinomonadaceae bacterium]|nr:DUF3458 domain-containing protein [Pyrinomonadaceae bacterium]MCX7639917.1 DUF3458 domain-containing protein [Pyrinomonadaceae bacterium]MDW8304089.1 DUF3458 domain-containing protein [Acidobacteriota bacterium]
MQLAFLEFTGYSENMKFARFSVLLFIFFVFYEIQKAEVVDFESLSKKFDKKRTYDVQHYKIKIEFDRGKKQVFGDVTIQLKPLEDGFSIVELDAAGLEYRFVGFESEVALRYEQKGEKLKIYLDRSYSNKETISIRVVYSCRPKKGVYFVEAEKRNGYIRDAQIWTQNEPEEAHHWLPSYDFPDDKATSEQIITVLPDETVIGNGELLSVSESEGKKTFHYRMNVPHSVYLISFVVGKYVKLADFYRDIPLGFYVYPQTEWVVPKAFSKTKDMFRIFEQLTGMPYPFNKYDQTIVARFRFGGMENITATTLADTEIFAVNFLPNEIEDLVAHELAHSWFGNLVTCQNWAELWLNEGFASFMEAAYRERMYGRKDYMRKIKEDAQRYFAYERVNKNRHGLFNQLARPDDSIFNPIPYQKGSAFLHTLREQVGDAAFWKAVQKYLQRHKFGNARTSNLKRVFEEVSGQNLDWFFYQWVYMAGFPQVEVKPVYYKNRKRLEITFTQKQTVEELVPQAFILPLEIELQDSKGKKLEKIRLSKRTEKFSFKMVEKPQTIVIDPLNKQPLMLLKMQSLETVN